MREKGIFRRRFFGGFAASIIMLTDILKVSIIYKNTVLGQEGYGEEKNCRQGGDFNLDI